MDKRGALYFKLITGLIALILGLHLAARVFPSVPDYELQRAQFCEVGDGVTVSGFVVRSEEILCSRERILSTATEGQRVAAAQSVAELAQGAVLVSKAGYFSSVADGYEGVLTPGAVLDPEQRELQSLVAEPVPEQSFGRLILGQSWYFASEDCPEGLRQGQRLSLRLGTRDYDVQVCRTDSLLVLRCDSYLHELTALRQVQAELITETHSGLRVSKRAIYHEEGRSWVYVLQGACVRRLPVEILAFDGSDALLQGDKLFEGTQVILTEQKLEDGMVLE